MVAHIWNCACIRLWSFPFDHLDHHRTPPNWVWLPINVNIVIFLLSWFKGDLWSSLSSNSGWVYMSVGWCLWRDSPSLESFPVANTCRCHVFNVRWSRNVLGFPPCCLVNLQLKGNRPWFPFALVCINLRGWKKIKFSSPTRSSCKGG